jgi:hypothetical protein
LPGGLGMILVAVSILAYDLYLELLYRRALALPGAGAVLPQWRWRTSLALALLAWGPFCWRSALWLCRAAWRESGSAK